jgi:hypothetical protein
MAHSMKKPTTGKAYAIVCTNQSALKLDDLTPNFAFVDGEIKDVVTGPFRKNESESEPESDSAVEKSFRYVPTIQRICMDEDTAKYACVNLMIEHQGTEVAFHVEEVVLNDTPRPDFMCDALEKLLDKVEVRKIDQD